MGTNLGNNTERPGGRERDCYNKSNRKLEKEIPLILAAASLQYPLDKFLLLPREKALVL